MSQQTILDGIRVASPCQASWDGMTGDDRQRACQAYGKDVYNLSSMTVADALALVSAPGPPRCVRFYRRADGTVLTADCPVGAQEVGERRLFKALAAVWWLTVMATGTLAGALAYRRTPDQISLTPPSPREELERAVIVGESPRIDLVESRLAGGRAALAGWVDATLIAVGLRQPRVIMGEAEAVVMGPPVAPAVLPVAPVAVPAGQGEEGPPVPTPAP